MSLKNFFNESNVGTSGTFKPEVDMNGAVVDGVDYSSVNFDGEFVYYGDSEYISISEDGKWKFLKEGKTTVQYGYIPSSQMLADMTAAAKEQGKELNLKAMSLASTEVTIYENHPSNGTINAGMTIKGPSEVKVGDSGTFDISIDPSALNQEGMDFSHIEFDGEYVFYYDESLISIDEKGNWKALKAGDATFGYLWRPSEAMWEEMNKVIEASGKEFILTAIQPIHELTITEKSSTHPGIQHGINIKMPSEVYVGDSGTFEISVDPSALNRNGMDFSHIKFDGEIVFDYDESLVSIDGKGNWKALKAGDATFTCHWIPSEAMWKEMKKVIDASGEDFLLTTEAIYYPFTIKDRSGSSGTSDTSGKEPSGKLPTTGEVQSSLIIAGVILLAGAAIFITKRRKHT